MNCSQLCKMFYQIFLTNSGQAAKKRKEEEKMGQLVSFHVAVQYKYQMNVDCTVHYSSDNRNPLKNMTLSTFLQNSKNLPIHAVQFTAVFQLKLPPDAVKWQQLFFVSLSHKLTNMIKLIRKHSLQNTML